VKLEQRELITSVYGSARILLAHLDFLWKRPQTALKILSDVLAQCQRDNTPGIILQEGPIVTPLLQLAMTRNVQADYVQRLLELLGEPIAPAATPARSTKDPLTQRELEVLCLIAAGASNRAIAEKLVISLPTVKSHIAHIMNKLDASSRTAVVARARALTIIE
jgi:LuxR family maltose regulon positive regulatory protein